MAPTTPFPTATSLPPEMQTVQGRRMAAIELTAIMAVTGVGASEAKRAIEDPRPTPGPRRSAALNTARFFIDAALRRDAAALEQMIALPFLIENRLIGIQEEINSQWIDRLRSMTNKGASNETVAIIYSVVQSIDEFMAVDPGHTEKIQYLHLGPGDYMAGLVVAVGTIAEPVNVFIRQHQGAMKISGLWS